MKAAIASGLALACCLLACAQDAGGPVPVQSTVNALPAVRVILQFNRPTDYQSEPWLNTLQAQTQAQVHYIAAVSNDTHVYRFQPAAGDTYAQLLQRLSALPEVLRVELDQKVKIP